MRTVSALCVVAATALGCSSPEVIESPATLNIAIAQPAQLPGACDGCRIEFDDPVIVGDFSGEGSLAEMPRGVRRLRDGRIALIDGEEPARVLLFGADGRFLRRIGRAGSGPGELEVVGGIYFIDPDTLVVAARGAQAVTVQAPRLLFFDTGGRYLKTETPKLPLGGFTWISGQTQLLTQIGLGPAGTRRPLTFVVRARQRLGDSLSFLDYFPASDSAAPVPGSALFADSTTLWVSRRGSATIVLIDTLGAMQRVIARRPPWFQFRDLAAPVGARPPMSSLHGVITLQDSALMLAASVPAPGWEKAYAPGGPLDPSRGEIRGSTVPWTILSHTIVEVLDPKTELPLAAARLAEYPVGLFPGGYLATYVEDADGIPRLLIRRVRFTVRAPA